jgi:hypothetical protein
MQCGVRTNAVNNVNITHISETGNNMNDYQLGDVANDHVLTQGGWLPIGHARNQAVEADRKARSIATYERASGIAWILIGVLQIAMVITILESRACAWPQPSNGGTTRCQQPSTVSGCS